MNNMRKCIGVIIARPNMEYQQRLLKGIYKAAFENDMNVAVFSSTIQDDVGLGKLGEQSVFSLPNYKKLSGVIYVPDTFNFDNMQECIEARLLSAVKKESFPAVCVDYTVNDMPCYFSDDSDAVKTLTEHIINEHNCHDIAFMTGFKGHCHSEKRLMLFLDVMNKHGLCVSQGRTYYGDFWYGEGEKFVASLIESEQGLPEAIICANEHMACSVYKALRKRNYCVPKDIVIAAYCGHHESVSYMTTVVNNPENTGYEACTALIEMINGKTILPEKVNVQCSCTINKSLTCGCRTCEEYDYIGKTLEENTLYDKYLSVFNQMEGDLIRRPNFREMFHVLDWYTYYLEEIKGISFCLCDGWNIPDMSADEYEYNGYTDRMQIYYSRKKSEDSNFISVVDENKYFNIDEMFPDIFRSEGKPSSFIFRALHFFDRCFGYIVIDNGELMQTYNDTFDFWIRDIANAIEAQRRLQNTKYLYSSDLMTGIFNRNGFNNMLPDFINETRRNCQQMLLIVADLNGLKYINDTFGHIEGDKSIKTAAKILSEHSVTGTAMEKNFRIGGDEFVKVAAGFFTENSVREFRERIFSCFEHYNHTSGNSYPVYMSMGVVIKNCTEKYTVESLVSEADEKMFEDKTDLKRKTGFNPSR